MVNPTVIMPGVIFYSYRSQMIKEKVAFMENNTLVMQIAGRFTLETAHQRVSMEAGNMLLIQKNQLATLTKTPLDGRDYETIVISLQEDLLRQIALDEKIEVTRKYTGPANVPVPKSDFLQGFFQSLLPYVHHPD